jgi:hypothetical protein
VSLDLLPRETYLAEFASRHQHDGLGLVVLSECRLCGLVEWSSTYTKEPAGYRVEQRPESQCGQCRDARYRSPEAFDWVVNVLVFHGVLK